MRPNVRLFNRAPRLTNAPVARCQLKPVRRPAAFIVSSA